MAKVTGPFLSLDASGTIAKVLTASRWKGINYMRQRVIPSNPQSATQVAIRDLITDASAEWKNGSVTLDATLKELYDTAAEGLALSGFNLFIKDAVGKNGGSAYDGTFVCPTEVGDNTA